MRVDDPDTGGTVVESAHVARLAAGHPGEDRRVAVLMGGANTERNVSLSSGLAVAHALRTLGYRVAEVDSATPLPYPGGRAERLFTGEEPTVVSARPIAPPAAIPPTPAELAALRAGQTDDGLAPGVLDVCAASDVVFVTTFGDEGEAGTTQSTLTARGIPFTGPPPDACARTFDKATAKAIVRAAGVAVPAGVVVRPDHVGGDPAQPAFGPPWIVKPVCGGSTIGLTLCGHPDELPAAVRRASAGGSPALVEEYVAGRDLTVGAMGGRVFPVVEIVTDRDLYDYTAKYRPGQADKRVPADLTDAELGRVQSATRTVHDALGLGPTSSRTDFRLAADGSLWFLETNPLPGMTPTSTFPKSAAAAGEPFPQLCHELVQLALAGRRPPIGEPAAGPG